MPRFAEILSAFGVRTADDDEYFTTCHCQKASITQKGGNGGLKRSGKTLCFLSATTSMPLRPLTCVDICYNVRFVERHGRDGLTDPWSFRQAAVYHSYSYERRTCSWVFVQLPKSLRARLKREGRPLSPLLIHVLIHRYCASEWRWYINYLSDLVSKMVSIVCQSCASITYVQVRGTSLASRVLIGT